jgi:hypothetical protein
MTIIEKPLDMRGFICLISGENLPAIDGNLSRAGFYFTSNIRLISVKFPASIL